jgi:hypothetical protein
VGTGRKGAALVAAARWSRTQSGSTSPPRPATTPDQSVPTCTHTGGDPLDAALELLQDFLALVIDQQDGEPCMDTAPAEQLNAAVERAVALNIRAITPLAERGSREAALAAAGLRLVTEWAADERDRRRQQVETLRRSLAA